jgi:hypothetical protein
VRKRENKGDIEDSEREAKRPSATAAHRTCGRSGRRRRARRRRQGDELAREGELFRQAGAGRLEAKGTRVRLRGKRRLDVAQVLVRRRVARVEANRLLELGARLAVLAARRVDRGQVVVRLGELGVILHELLQQRLRFGSAAEVGQDHRLQEPHLRVLRLRGEGAVGQRQRGGRLACVMKPSDLAQLVGRRGRRCGRKHGTEEQHRGEDPELHR